jgi:hypothetical protein
MVGLIWVVLFAEFGGVHGVFWFVDLKTTAAASNIIANWSKYIRWISLHYFS